MSFILKPARKKELFDAVREGDFEVVMSPERLAAALGGAEYLDRKQRKYSANLHEQNAAGRPPLHVGSTNL